MDIKTMTDRFLQLANSAVGSPDTLGIFKNSASKMFSYLSERDQRKAEEMLGELEQIQYNNFLTRDEAKKIIDRMKNYDNTMGGKWRCDEVENFLRSKGMPTEEMPYYNSYALAVAMNRIHSDYGGEIKELTDDYTIACYNFALCDLKDKDRPRWIRNYFREILEM